jgi:hypothetical protein
MYLIIKEADGLLLSFITLETDFLTAWHLITKGNIDYFDKAFQMMLPPRLILPGFICCCNYCFFFSPDFYFYVLTAFV